MATQAIRFLGPPGQTVTLDVFTLASDVAEQAALVCTEATNRKGLYVTANFTDTLDGRFLIVGKVAGDAVGNDLVDMLNANATYDSHALMAHAATAATQSTTAATQSTTAATQATTAATQATTAATEVGKIPRLSTAIAAGVSARRTKVAATSTTLDETLGATP